MLQKCKRTDPPWLTSWAKHNHSTADAATENKAGTGTLFQKARQRHPSFGGPLACHSALFAVPEDHPLAMYKPLWPPQDIRRGQSLVGGSLLTCNPRLLFLHTLLSQAPTTFDYCSGPSPQWEASSGRRADCESGRHWVLPTVSATNSKAWANLQLNLVFKRINVKH